MNMGSLVSRYGPSPQAFMVVPIVGAFFIDIVNLIILQVISALLGNKQNSLLVYRKQAAS